MDATHPSANKGKESKLSSSPFAGAREGKGIDLKSFASAIAQIAEEKEIPMEKIIETIEFALASAYKKDYGKKGQIIKPKCTWKQVMLSFGR